MASAARGRLLQLLSARVRHAQAAPAQWGPACASARRNYSAGVGGAGVSSSAAATSAEVASAAAAAAIDNQQQQQKQNQQPPVEEAADDDFETNDAAASTASPSSSYPFSSAPPPPPPGAPSAPPPLSAPPPFRPPPPTPPAAPPSSSSGGGAEADAAAAAWLYRRFRQRGGADLAFDVIQFFPDGTALEHHRPLTPAELELHPRDVGLFAPSPRLAAPQRATIAVHDDKVLFRTEVARAIITADRAVLFKSARRRAETARMARAILSALQAPSGAGGAAEASSSAALPQLPFELRVLEVLLDATADYFYRKTQHLNWMLEAVGGDEGASSSAWASVAAAGGGGGGGAGGNGNGNGGVGDGGDGSRSDASVASSALRSGPMAALARAEPFAAMDKAHQLVPVQRFLTAVKADVQETAKAIEALIEDPESLEELCLTHRRQLARQQHARGAAAAAGGAASSAAHAPGASASPPSLDVKLANNMLESYLREIQSIEGSLRETEENLENTRQGWQIALDASRNHIIQVNMWMSLVSISVMAATLLPAALGMNLDSGLPADSPAAFAGVCAASLAIALLSFPLGRALYLRHWRKVAQQELFEQKMLRVLLMQHADELDDVVAALGRAHRAGHPLDRTRFRAILGETLGSKALSAGKADFLWHLFDTDRSGFLSEAEVLRRVSADEGRLGGGGGGLPAAVAEVGSGGGGAGAGAAAGAAALVGASATVRRPPPMYARTAAAAAGS